MTVLTVQRAQRIMDAYECKCRGGVLLGGGGEGGGAGSDFRRGFEGWRGPDMVLRRRERGGFDEQSGVQVTRH